MALGASDTVTADAGTGVLQVASGKRWGVTGRIMAGTATLLAGANPRRIGVITSSSGPAVAIYAAGGGEIGNLQQGRTRSGRPLVIVVQAVGAGKQGSRRDAATKTGEIGIVDGEAHFDQVIFVGSAGTAVIGVTVASEAVHVLLMLCVRTRIWGKHSQRIGRRKGHIIEAGGGIAMAVIASPAPRVFEAPLMGMALHAIGAVVMVLPIDLPGTVLVETGLVMTDFADILRG
jgi:hypothetical protein